MAHQFIFTMKDLRKVVPPKREILKGIWLSFYPGAKIGVLGSNGAGKSTLLRIMAGVDQDFLGEARPADGIKIGYLPQEPRLDPGQGRARQRRGRRGATCGALLTRFDEINAAPRRADGRRRDGEAARGAGARAGRHRGRQRLGSGPHRRDRHGRAARSAGRRRRRDAVGRRGAPRRPLPPPAPEARHAAARRADQPPRRRIGGLARALPQGVSGHGRRHHPRSLLPRQRRGLDPRARPRRGHPLGGELLAPGSSRSSSGWPRRRSRTRRGSGRSSASSSGCGCRRARARRSPRRGWPSYEELLAEDRPRARRHGRDHHPDAARASATSWCRPRALGKGYGDRLLIDDLSFSLPRGGIVGVIGAERRGQDDAVPHDHRARRSPTAARSASASR